MRSLNSLRVSRLVPTIAAAAALFALAAPGSASAYTLATLHSFCNWANCGDGVEPFGLLRDASGNLYGATTGGGKYGDGVAFKLTLNPDTGTYKESVLHNFCARANCADGSNPQGELIMDANGSLYGIAAYGGKYGGGAVFKLTHGANGWGLSVVHSFCANPGCTDGNRPGVALAYAGQASGAPWDGSSPLFGTTIYGGANDKGAVYQLVPNGAGWTYQVIRSFSSVFDGGPLLVDSSGNLFGTTASGGKYNGGILYRLAAGTWTETTLHNFCNTANCADGYYPWGRLLIDASGDLFGATQFGGSGAHCTDDGGCGVVFERTPGGSYEVIYDFCSAANCADGDNPYAGVIMDSSDHLFGTTDHGGAKGDYGTVFELTNNNGNWSESTLYSFCEKTGCADGEHPLAPLIMNASGDLFGTTYVGGANGSGGTVFELTP
jgi:uncharacterized repeat protein (TIGR03803 family)